MAEILIKNMELPHTVTIFPNGDIEELINGKYVTTGKAIILPSHGDLVERDYLKQHLEACETNGRPLYRMNLQERLDCLDDVPVVLEANYGTDS